MVTFRIKIERIERASRLKGLFGDSKVETLFDAIVPDIDLSAVARATFFPGEAHTEVLVAGHPTCRCLEPSPINFPDQGAFCGKCRKPVEMQYKKP